MPNQLHVFESTYELNDDGRSFDVSLRITDQTARRIEAQAPEAVRLQEAIRMVLEHGLRVREQEHGVDDYSIRSDALDDIAEQLEHGQIAVETVD